MDSYSKASTTQRPDFYDIVEKGKPKGQKSVQQLPGAVIGEKGLTTKRHEETFWGDGNILYCDGGYMTLCIPENSSKYTPKKS